MHKGIAAAVITGSLLTGGAIGTALLGPGVATAQSSSSSDSSSSTAPALPGPGPGPGHRGGPHGPHGGPDLSVVAGAIGISEADLQTALQSGKSMADVATANNVDPQKVIDALVADAQTKLAAQVASGEITQAQADEMSADLTQHITDLVNHTGGPGGAGCPGMDGAGPPPDQGSSGSSSSSGSSGSGASLGT
ncbi:MAG: hypothetical protein QOI95_1418 [Acidimicrobiaceae bacterium]|jgi:hypothetical protein